MSNALLKVRFNDGLILYGQYHGTSDTCHLNLFDSVEEASSYNRFTPEGYSALQKNNEGEAVPEAVEIYSDYGSGWYWQGRACRVTKQITDNLDGFNEGYDTVPRDRIYSDDWAREDHD